MKLVLREWNRALSKYERNRAFTLVELVFSVAVIGTLSTISMGLFYEYQARSYTLEIETIKYDLRNASHVLLNAIPVDDPNVAGSPVCDWEFDSVNGDSDNGCDSENGTNVFMDVFNLKNRPVVVISQFGTSNTYGSAGWYHWSNVYHCKLPDQNNELFYQIVSNGSADLDVFSYEPPVTYAARCP